MTIIFISKQKVNVFQMVVVFRIGKIPIRYSAPILSMAFLVTFLLYVAAIVFPYLICGWTLNFFTPLETRTERPVVRGYPNMEFLLSGTTGTGADAAPLSIGFIVSNSSTITAPSGATVRIPVIHFPKEKDDRFLKLTAYFPLNNNEKISKVSVKFPFSANFTNMGRVFYSAINETAETSLTPTARLELLGSLTFSQDRALNNNRFTDVPLTQEFLDFAHARNLPMNSSDPSVGGRPEFRLRNAIWTYVPDGTAVDMFEIQVSMRVPITKVIVEREGWYAFLDGWTQYVSIAVPLFLVVWMALEALFKSGFIPVHEKCEADIEPSKIPKFNR